MACNAQDASPGAATDPSPEPGIIHEAFETDLLALKAELSDLSQVEARMPELLARHGLPSPARSGSFPQAGADPVPGEALSGNPAPLAKSAASAYHVVKRFTAANEPTFEDWYDLQPGHTLQVDAVRLFSPVDPSLLIYVRDSESSLATGVRVLRFNDDFQGVNARVVLANDGAATQRIYVLAFAATNQNRGGIRVTYRLNGSILATFDGMIAGGHVVYNNNVNPGNCVASLTDPNRFRFMPLRPDINAARANLLGVNLSTFFGNRSKNQGVWIGEGHTQRVNGPFVPSGYPSFLLVYSGTIRQFSVWPLSSHTAYQEVWAECQ